MNKRIILAYVITIHVFLGIVLAKSNFIKLVSNKLNLTTAQTEIAEYFNQMLAYHSRMDGNVPNESVIFIGDSIIQGLAVTAVVNPSVNYGIGNDTTVGVLKRLPVYHSIERASAVVIAIGINDMKYRSNEEILSNMKAISNHLPKNIPIIFSAVLPINEARRTDWQGRNHTRIKEFNLQLKKWVEASDNIFFVDAGPQLSDEKGNLADQFHEGDGMHLNSRGNAIWIQQLTGAIRYARGTISNLHGNSTVPLTLQ